MSHRIVKKHGSHSKLPTHSLCHLDAVRVFFPADLKLGLLLLAFSPLDGSTCPLESLDRVEASEFFASFIRSFRDIRESALVKQM